MIAAVSADFSKSDAASTADSTAYTWFKMPELNRATHRRLGQAGAGWTFETICRLVHHVGRVGRPQARQAARDLGRLSVGLQAIADEAGISVAKVRRDLVELIDIGLVTVMRRNVTFSADPATGRIVENRTGRSLPVIVFLNVGPEHLRTKAGQDRPAAGQANPPTRNPVTVEGAADPNRDHSGGAIQRHRNTKRVPDGQADGFGRPQARPDTGLTAGKAGGHAAAQAGHEGTHNDGMPVPIGRISRPAGKAPPPPRQAKDHFPEDHREPQAFTGRDADAFAATRRRLEAERQAREAQDAAWRAAREASTGSSTSAA